MAETLWALRQRLERLMGEALTGTPEGYLTVNTFGVPALGMYENDYFNDWRGRFYQGPHRDTSFTVTDFAQANGVVTFLPSLAVKVDATDLFELIPPDLSADEINDAINLAISMVEQEALQDKVDTTVETIASTYEYAVPAGFLYIAQIFVESGTANRYSPSADLIDARHWRILHGATPKIWIDNNFKSLTAGRNLRIVGQEAPDQLETDAAVCAVRLSFLIFQAKALLHQSRIRGSGVEFENHENQMQLAQAMADKERLALRVAGRGSKVAY